MKVKLLVATAATVCLSLSGYAQMTGGGGGATMPNEKVVSDYKGPKSYFMPLGVGLNIPKGNINHRFSSGYVLTSEVGVMFKGISSESVGIGMAINLFDFSTLKTNLGGNTLFLNGKIGLLVSVKVIEALTIDTKFLLGGGWFFPSDGLATQLGYSEASSSFSARHQFGINGRYALSDKLSAIGGLNFNVGRQNIYLSNYTTSSYYGEFQGKINTKQLFVGVALTW